MNKKSNVISKKVVVILLKELNYGLCNMGKLSLLYEHVICNLTMATYFPSSTHFGLSLFRRTY